jgi:hypothetical protein
MLEDVPDASIETCTRQEMCRDVYYDEVIKMDAIKTTRRPLLCGR